MNKPSLIVIEGACDGIGKTTQYNLLYDELIKDGIKVYKHHFPSYGKYQAKSVEEYLSGNYGNIKELSPYFINNLYATDRAITWYTTLNEKYENGYTLLLDRYTTSSLIFQTALIDDDEEKKKMIDWIIDFEYDKLGIKKPDKIIFLTAPFDVITRIRNERKQNDGILNDIHESDLNYMKKVYDNSQFVAKYLSWDIIDCSCNDNMLTIENINKKVKRKIKKD